MALPLKKSRDDVDSEDEYDFDYDSDDDKPEKGTSENQSQKAYVTSCAKYGISKNRNIMDSLLTNKMVVRNQGLSVKDTKALAAALLRNASVESLCLDSNQLGPEGLQSISLVLPQRHDITCLSIINNNLGSKGARDICSILASNSTITFLDLSGNGFTEHEADYFREVFEENSAIKKLNLSHNEFREKGGVILAQGIGKNDAVRVLDLSWNHLRLSGAVAVAKCLETNVTIEELNLGWNGFTVQGCVALGNALEVNANVHKLDLTCNRIDKVGLSHLLKGLLSNTSLKTLNLALNPICPGGALSVVKVVEKCDNISVNYIDLGEQSVSEEFMEVKKHLEQTRGVKILHGPVLRTEMDFGSIQQELDEEAEKSIDELMEENTLTILFEFARLQNFRVLDMFKALDADSNGTLSRDEFEKGLMEVNIPMPKIAINRLVRGMDVNRDGVIDFKELLNGYENYKIKVREATKEDDFKYTEIGRIGDKIREVMKQRFLMRHF